MSTTMDISGSLEGSFAGALLRKIFTQGPLFFMISAKRCDGWVILAPNSDGDIAEICQCQHLELICCATDWCETRYV